MSVTAVVAEDAVATEEAVAAADAEDVDPWLFDDGVFDPCNDETRPSPASDPATCGEGVKVPSLNFPDSAFHSHQRVLRALAPRETAWRTFPYGNPIGSLARLLDFQVAGHVFHARLLHDECQVTVAPARPVTPAEVHFYDQLVTLIPRLLRCDAREDAKAHKEAGRALLHTCMAALTPGIQAAARDIMRSETWCEERDTHGIPVLLPSSYALEDTPFAEDVARLAGDDCCMDCRTQLMRAMAVGHSGNVSAAMSTLLAPLVEVRKAYCKLMLLLANAQRRGWHQPLLRLSYTVLPTPLYSFPPPTTPGTWRRRARSGSSRRRSTCYWRRRYRARRPSPRPRTAIPSSSSACTLRRRAAPPLVSPSPSTRGACSAPRSWPDSQVSCVRRRP